MKLINYLSSSIEERYQIILYFFDDFTSLDLRYWDNSVEIYKILGY